MKTFSSICVIASFGFVALGQSQQTASVPAPSPYTIVSRDANSRVWERTTYELSPSGQVIPHVDRYTEMATGLCYKQNAQWMDSQEQINIMPDGSAEAIEGQHQAYFPSDIFNGVIKLVTPDGLKLLSQPVGISYNDGANTVLIANLTNSVGELISSNEVIYPNAFAGVSADLLYTYTKAGFEQDVILNEQPLPPEAYGLNPLTAKLQLVTEFFDPPQPRITTRTLPEQAGPELTDDTLDFGTMEMVQGRAFLLGANAEEGTAQVGKQWLLLKNRQFLVEEVPMAAIADQLSQLPAAQTSSIKRNSPLNVVSVKRLLPPQRLAKAIRMHPMQVTQVAIPKRGLLLDYQTINSSQTNACFQGDTTYYISGPLELFGTNTFEGGAVIKYTNGASITIKPTETVPVINWEASAYRPVIFTAKDDNSVGTAISGSTGNPSDSYYANPALQIVMSGPAPTVSYFRIAYAQQAVSLAGSYPPRFYNGQILDCQGGFTVNGADEVYLRNVLFDNVETNFNNLYVGDFDVQNSTFSSSTYLTTIDNRGGNSSGLRCTNCIFANVLNLTNNYTNSQIGYNVTGNNNGFYNSPVFGSVSVTNTTYPFQTVGGGSYYLTNGCAFHNVGTTNIDPTLLAELQQKTTWPPIVYADTNISGLGTLGPQAPRDISSAPDLGYHYDPLDYVFGGGDLHSNLTFTTGTAVGWFQEEGDVSSSGQPYAISLNNGANLSFNSNATQPCYFVRSALVQEGGNGNWTGSGYMGGIMFNGSSTGPEPQLSANFTKWTMDSLYYNFFRDNWAYGAADLKNCEFYDGSFAAYDMQNLTWTNCLFFRGSIEYYDQDYAPNITYENCTFYNGDIDMERYTYDGGYGSAYWLVENCSYDGTAFEWNDARSANTNYTLFNYNAYNTNNLSWTNYSYPYPPIHGTLETVGSNDLMVTNYNWQTSWFGNFYLPPWPDSPLLGMGSTNSNFLGLYHFTTQTNQTVEGTNIVDIGYHYVATDPYGNPLDSNGDGIPDYLEDAAGNGSGNWDTTMFFNVLISQPQNGGNLP